MPGIQKFTYILGDLNCNILSKPPEVHTTHLLDLMVDYISDLLNLKHTLGHCVFHVKNI